MRAQPHERWPVDPDPRGANFEHVVIEATPDADTVAGLGDVGDVPLATHYLNSPFHGYTMELSLHANHCARVRLSRADGSARDYLFDLGFLGPRHTRVRQVPWGGYSIVAAMLAAGAGTMAFAWAHGTTLTHPFFVGLVGCLLVVLGTLTAVPFLRRTTETLELRSLHGQAPLARITGGLGSSRQHTALVCDLAKGAKAARAARPRDRRQFLRDEMRAHHGLHASGVLTTEEYESSKARILAAHDQVGIPGA